VALEDNLLYQLKCIFIALAESEEQFFNPGGLCGAFKDWDGNPVNVYEQMDVDEFYNQLMDKLENLVKDSGEEDKDFIKDHFGGTLSNELICKGCPHYYERDEPFGAIPLNVKNKKTIHDSLKAFIEGEMLEGDNAYKCEKCDKKVDTLKRVTIKKLPNHLFMVLKRFEFNYYTM
jgi:ubiquitin carboxyl-terminal hydrolase 9/24